MKYFRLVLAAWVSAGLWWLDPGRLCATPAPAGQGAPDIFGNEAVTKRGLLTTHLAGGRVYLEFPKGVLASDMIVVGRIRKSPLEFVPGDWAEFVRRFFQFQRRGSSIELRTVGDERGAPQSESPLTLPLSATAPDGSAAFDASALFDRFATLRAPVIPNAAHARIDRVSASERGLEVDGAFPTQQGAEVLVHWSLEQLPSPMLPRLADPHVNFVAVERAEPRTQAGKVRYIERWRLEKQDPEASVSPPVCPITYYIDASVPRIWVPYIKEGIEQWNVAFLAAGFRNAVVVEEPPRNDPDWSPLALRHNMIVWTPGFGSAEGTHVDDPRTGEILGASVLFSEGYLSQLRIDYFLSAGGVDPAAANWPVPQRILGSLVRGVIAHEVGHSLGFEHNLTDYPAGLLRNPSWAREAGCAPSVVGYRLVNPVAQPQDYVPLDALCARVGPFDRFAIAWGYTPIPGARTPSDELATLGPWLGVQDACPWLRWRDPVGEESAAVAARQCIEFVSLWSDNFQRLGPALATWVVDPAVQNQVQGRMYEQALLSWSNELRRVVSIVGGPAPDAEQRAAVAFLNERAFHPPQCLLDPTVLRRWEPREPGSGVARRQAEIIGQLLNRQRFESLLSRETKRQGGYRVADFVADLRGGIWRELDGPVVKIDPDRKRLQSRFLGVVSEAIMPPPPEPPLEGFPAPEPRRPVPEAAIAILQAEMTRLAKSIESAKPRADNEATRKFLGDVQTEVLRIATLPSQTHRQ